MEGAHICTHTKMHQDPVTGPKGVVDHAKLTCWEKEKIRDEVLDVMDEMDQ